MNNNKIKYMQIPGGASGWMLVVEQGLGVVFWPALKPASNWVSVKPGL